MNQVVLERPRTGPVRTRGHIVDCDVHITARSAVDLYPWLSAQWRAHVERIGPHVRGGIYNQEPHPRMMARGMRADSYPEEGGPPGCSLPLLQRQHLDPNGIEFGMLIALGRGIFEERNQHFAEALSRAINDWQCDRWVDQDNRLVAAIIVPQEDADVAVSELARRAADRSFKQVLLSPKAQEPLGRKRYWPIYAAAERAGLPIAFHPAAIGGGHASSGAGAPTYYLEEHNTFGTIMQAVLTSLIFEGVFERFPRLKVVAVEGGFTWAPSLAWRMDKHWSRLRVEVPHVTRSPSEYLRQNVWFTTQPMEETRKQAHLRDVIDWLGWDRLMFSSDYPHWDFDDPRYAFKIALSDEERTRLFSGNAKALYGLP
jgi:predicted TIM-barrel fold metal-dependent hydrolase